MLMQQGFELFGRVIEERESAIAREVLFRSGGAGARCLLDQPIVQQIAGTVRATLVQAGRLPAGAVAIQAIAFDKTPDANWKVTWHQDVMFPFARPVQTPGFDLASRKDGADYARPPLAVLEALLAVRVHLDDCDAGNGPLRVSSGTHQCGILRSSAIQAMVAAHGETLCLAKSGEALLMKPLLLHASSPATAPRHRRVLHLVYHSGEPIPEPWHRTC